MTLFVDLEAVSCIHYYVAGHVNAGMRADCRLTYTNAYVCVLCCVEDSFVNSQEWTLSRSVPDLKLVSFSFVGNSVEAFCGIPMLFLSVHLGHY